MKTNRPVPCPKPILRVVIEYIVTSYSYWISQRNIIHFYCSRDLSIKASILRNHIALTNTKRNFEVGLLLELRTEIQRRVPDVKMYLTNKFVINAYTSLNNTYITPFTL